MKADNITLQGILNSPNRYLIPVFQRYYSWGRKEWSQLWENIQELHEADDAQSHFMGALVFVPDTYEANTMPTYLVIDGQQRLITLSLMLCALRNIARSSGHSSLAAEITDTFLIHPYKRGNEHYRVFPRQRDRDEYVAVLEHRGYRGTRNRITEALVYFLRQLQNLAPQDGFAEDELRQFVDLVKTGLEFVYITLDEENPYRIFKSLNSTGMNLSEADLIRNFMLMSVGTDTSLQDQFDDQYWRPLERLFEDDEGQLNARDFSFFFRDFLMIEGKYIPLSSTFYYFERRYHHPGFDPQQLASYLQQVAQLYNMIRGLVAHQSRDINRALHRLRRLNNTATYPLLLSLLMYEAHHGLSAADFVTAVDRIRDFLQRQLDEEKPNRSLARWFVAACRELGDRPLPNLEAYLATKEGNS